MSKTNVPTSLPVQHRAAKIDAAPKEGERRSGADPGRFEFTVSSEEPVRRWFGDEILNHDKSAVRCERLDSGMVPLLFNHDPNQHLGAVDDYALKGGSLRVAGQFSNNPLGQEKRRDYDDGILKAASVGYKVHKIVRTEDEDNPNAPDRCDVTDWEPFDASLVTVPADPTVGVGRSENAGEEFPVEFETVLRRSAEPAPVAQPVIEVQPKQEKRNMAETANTLNPAEIELARRDAIMAVAADKDFGKYFTVEDAQRSIKDGTSADAVKDSVTRKIVDANDANKVGTLGDHTFASADRRDQRNYSLVNLIRSMVGEVKPELFKGSRSTATFEREMSAELGKRLGKTPEGFFVPISALTRALGTQTIAESGGQIGLTSEAAAVETVTRPEVIELLRHRPRCMQLGARVLGGLQGIVRLPRQSGAGTWQWLGEGATVTPADLTMDFVSVQPRRGSTQSGVDIELLASTSPDVEGLIRADFNKVRNLALDYAALNGPLGGPGPVGLLNATGLAVVNPTGTVSKYTTSKMLSYADITNVEAIPAAADADVATSGFMVTPGMRAALKSTPMFAAGYAQPIWTPGKHDPSGLEEGPLGYTAAVTNQLPTNGTQTGYTGPGLHTGVFGDWAQLIFADWGVVEVIYDPYTQAGSGAIVLTMRSLHDNAIRHIAAFTAMELVAVA
jgi:phage head maturation protease